MWRAKCSPLTANPSPVSVIACDNVFSGRFLNGGDDCRVLVFYKKVMEINSFNESVPASSRDADPVRESIGADLTRVL